MDSRIRPTLLLYALVIPSPTLFSYFFLENQINITAKITEILLLNFNNLLRIFFLLSNHRVWDKPSDTIRFSVTFCLYNNVPDYFICQWKMKYYGLKWRNSQIQPHITPRLLIRISIWLANDTWICNGYRNHKFAYGKKINEIL